MSNVMISLTTFVFWSILAILEHYGYFKPNIPLLPLLNCGISLNESAIGGFDSNSFIKNPKIMFGNEAKPHSFPWVVSLRAKNYRNVHFCGGVIIHPLYVIR